MASTAKGERSMSIQRQFNRHGVDIAEARVAKSETGGIKRSKKPRFRNSYRQNALTTEERIQRAAHLKGFFGINPTIKQGATQPRRNPSIYMPHVGGKGYKTRPSRPKQTRVTGPMTVGQIFGFLKSVFRKDK
jgi:hypothetical protein